MTLKTYFDAFSMETTDTIIAGSWNTIYVVYAFTASGYGISKIYINGVDNNGEATTMTSPGPAIFTPADTIKIGQGFAGELRRFQVYSPAAFGLATDNCIDYFLPSFFKRFLDLCDSSSCSVEMGFSDPLVCQEAVCSTSGYPAFDTCECNKELILLTNIEKACDDGRCQVCEDPQTCKICKSRFVQISGSCQRIIFT